MPAILIIEDNREIHENTAELLELEGFAILSARNGREGVESAKTHLPDLILCDIMMPEMNGWEVLERLRSDQSRASIPVAVMSGSHRGEVRAANYVVPKPFDLTHMVELVREHCNVRSSSLEMVPESLRLRTDRASRESIETTAA